MSISIYKILRDYPPISEWNLLHRKRGILAVDMDGVICKDCPSHIDLDEHKYAHFLNNAKPYLIPNYEIDYIISCRLEKYRQETETWLAKHGVRYKSLILWDLPSKAHRMGQFSKHKIDVLLKVKPSIYWESSYGQALKIWRNTKIPTICIDEMIAFGIIAV